MFSLKKYSLLGMLFFGGYINTINQNVYTYINIDFKDYYEEHHRFFVTLFGSDYIIVPTKSLQNLTNIAYIITVEVPKNDSILRMLKQYPKEKILLFSFETQLLNPRSHDPHYFSYYSKVFTWNDDFIDNIYVFKVRFPWMDPRPMISDRTPFHQKKFCVFVGNNYPYGSIYANYSARKNIIDFFEENAVEDFDLYGNYWKALEVYKGVIPLQEDRRLNKINVLDKYKFDICYENTKNIRGWISERIFEDFAAGCIPIYCGAENIESYIPKNCYILRKDFIDNKELYEYIKSITETEYLSYIDAINSFLASQDAYRLSTAYYIQCIRTILNITVEEKLMQNILMD